MSRHDDDFDIIGSRPKPAPIEKQLEGLSLFDDPRVRETHKAPDRAGATVIPARIPEPKREKPTQLPPLTEREKERLAAIERIKELVAPLLLKAALDRKDRENAPGVTADDVYLLAQRFPQVALLGGEQRAFSWSGPWLAELAAKGKLAPFALMGVPVLRRSTQRGRNRQQVYLHPDDRRVDRG